MEIRTTGRKRREKRNFVSHIREGSDLRTVRDTRTRLGSLLEVRKEKIKIKKGRRLKGGEAAHRLVEKGKVRPKVCVNLNTTSRKRELIRPDRTATAGKEGLGCTERQKRDYILYFVREGIRDRSATDRDCLPCEPKRE